jgi:hypothetical protein
VTRLLVVSPDAKWIEYLQLGLEPLGIEVVAGPVTRSADKSVSALGSGPQNPFAGVLISALATPGQSQNDALLETKDVLAALRKASGSVPILLWSPYPSERLASIASGFTGTVMLTNDAPAALKASLAGASPDTGLPPRAANVELQIGATNIRTEVALDGKPVGIPSSRDWSGRYKMKQLEDQFVTWAPLQHDGGTSRYTDNWLQTLRVAGEDISYETDYTGTALSEAITYCLEKVKTLDLIHFRFNLLSPGPDTPNPFAHVPFEMLYDPNKKNFVRALAPVSRRICLSSESRTATAVENTKPLIGHVLFVKSDAHGSYESSGPSFRGKRKLSLRPLEALNDEFDAVKKSRTDAGRAPPELLELAVGGAALTQLQERLAASQSDTTPTLQIIHYAGHSTKADDDTTYLILPGAVEGELKPLRMSEFATWGRKAGVQLVILSSCESSGPEAVFRLSQTGIPAVIGFRWEVNDKEAAFFTGRVHKALAEGLPLARAFYVAVNAVGNEYEKSPTFASPMLAVQDDEWTN